ncbi:MAG TPA: GH116 family glycosyl hydrolase [Flavitalea sp.]|nr:GH116 family glycosyl hydrolase [Flavitalea sp.]
MERRKFLQSSGLLGTAFFTARFPLIAGPFEKKDFLFANRSTDKKFNREWVNSLCNRGEVTKYRKTKNELHFIGMPVGGICCGGVYVGGDGRLWLWDIFNQNQLGAVNKVLPIKMEGSNSPEINNVHGSLYLEPLTVSSLIQQGLAIVIHQKDTTIVKRLIQDDWEEVIFEATYPVATITYIDKSLAIKVIMNSFSPFIPGDAKNSGLPATIQSITVRNDSVESRKIEIKSWLENKMLVYTEEKNNDFTRENKVIENEFYKGVALECKTDSKELKQAADFGNMSLGTLVKNAQCVANLKDSDDAGFKVIKDIIIATGNSPIAAISTEHVLNSQTEIKADFFISWFTPNISFTNMDPEKDITVQDARFHFYSSQFSSAADVLAYIGKTYTSLQHQTFLWKKTWYDSSLPWWFLERTFLNISTLATTTSHRLQSGRFYAWEGVGCCHGTCTHVYQYAHAMSRIFPELERDTRQRVDLGISFDEETGMIRYRGENTGPSIDGQAGTILRIYREYLMSGHDELLKNNWSKIKKAVEFVIRQDKNGDGMEDTPMENTLDALWSGEISWIVGLCIASVRAGQLMAEEMNDKAFAEICNDYWRKGQKNMEKYLFNGEYFIHRADPKTGKSGLGSYNTCHIDQVYGQSWAWQLGLGRILDKEKTKSALTALWKYNFLPDVGPYISKNKGGRYYAVAGEGGMVMNTNPKNDPEPYGKTKAWQIGYFNECMSGFEHQVASHMMAEGMIEESLILTRTIHDRYHAFKRNPFNEIECSDHYARAMSSYGTFINACGFTYHGTKGHIGFAPKLTPEDFKAPFTVAQGWGTYSQQRNENEFSCKIKLEYGRLKLKSVAVELAEKHKMKRATIVIRGRSVPCTFEQVDVNCKVDLVYPILLRVGQILTLKIF